MLEKIKKTAKHSFIYSIGNATNKLVGFILLPLYTSVFPVATYGLLALFDTIADFLLEFSSFGIIEGLKRWYWDRSSEGKQKALFFTVLLFTLLSTLFFLFAAYLIIDRYSVPIFGVSIPPRMLLLFLGSVLTNVLLQRILILQRIQQKALENTIFNVLRMLFVLGATVYFIVVLNWGLESVFVSRLLGQAITLLLLLPQFIRNCELKVDLPVLKDMLSYSWPLGISASLGLIFTLSDRWLLQGMKSLDVVGNYSLAYKIANVIKLLVVQSFTQAFVYIYFRKMDNQKDYRFFSKSTTYFSYILVMLGLLIIVFSKEIIHLMAQNADYYDSYFILPYLMLAVAFSGLRQMLVLPLNKYKKTKLISVITLSAGVLNIGLNLLLIPRWGGVGAALATAAAHLSVVVAFLFMNKRLADFDYEIPKIVLLFAVGIFFAFISAQTEDLFWYFRIPFKAMLILFYPLILKLFGFYEDIELLRIRQSWKKWRNPLRWKENFKDINFRN